MNVQQFSVQVALLIDIDDAGLGGADQLHYALEAMAGVAAKGLMDTHSGVRSWVASRWSDAPISPDSDDSNVIQTIGLLTTDPRWEHVESPLLLEFALALLDRLADSQPSATEVDE